LRGRATGVAGACGYASAAKGVILNVPDRSVSLRPPKQALDELRPGFDGDPPGAGCFNNAKFNSIAEVIQQVRL